MGGHGTLWGVCGPNARAVAIPRADEMRQHHWYAAPRSRRLRHTQMRLGCRARRSRRPAAATVMHVSCIGEAHLRSGDDRPLDVIRTRSRVETRLRRPRLHACLVQSSTLGCVRTRTKTVADTVSAQWEERAREARQRAAVPRAVGALEALSSRRRPPRPKIPREAGALAARGRGRAGHQARPTDSSHTGRLARAEVERRMAGPPTAPSGALRRARTRRGVDGTIGKVHRDRHGGLLRRGQGVAGKASETGLAAAASSRRPRSARSTRPGSPSLRPPSGERHARCGRERRAQQQKGTAQSQSPTPALFSFCRFSFYDFQSAASVNQNGALWILIIFLESRSMAACPS